MTTMWERLLERWGLPTAFAVALLVFVLGVIYNDLSGMSAANAQALQELRDHVVETQHGQSEMRWYLRQICLNTADSETERTGCVLPYETR